MNKTLVLLATCLISFVACKKEKNVVSTPLSAVVKQDINANHANYQYYSFAKGDTVPFADSSTTKWDIAFKGTSIILNSGISGSGNAGVIIKDTLFSEVLTAPITGYAQDASTGKGIPTGSGNGWYNYNPDTHLITPIVGRVFIIRTADNKYAKMQIINYYHGNPVTIDESSASKYFTIRYIYQPDGSTNLK